MLDEWGEGRRWGCGTRGILTGLPCRFERLGRQSGKEGASGLAPTVSLKPSPVDTFGDALRVFRITFWWGEWEFKALVP